MNVLGIESSCDETGVALVRVDGDAPPRLLAHALHSQIVMHQPYGGVVPELASRDHIRRVLPLAQRVLEEMDILNGAARAAHEQRAPDHRGCGERDDVTRESEAPLQPEIADVCRIDARGLAAGQTGGTVHLLGWQVEMLGTANIDASGDAGGGTVLVGGDYQGLNPLIRRATNTLLQAETSIRRTL